ncbi:MULTISPECIES: xanthine dehydrogenase family protein molybdopterin-binding subunit [unclassified Pseudomonas]|uniref:xanthine dehydrogenase family protein molybdopterin-binding subunit n=2 Tax=Pseudomonas TaxID=286 RepID=UPI002AC8B342|nr:MULTISPECIES: xanthine dehydrogenase family protein molybdopterin-binding subunit [unclassified Pseudomonas]MEB0042990.1 xanthine dehydrogenase family protein molybdopterin-binding subunit [Pseudomonas sp. MH10]MEB0123285.1 xanthine dehydrogenase family protein molybdopterin-binding subunit [Pseudomonas sp. CCI1.2]WPX65403.1 xanthine dehydrogenase family protein molybdopterin-binding subunit [Pseudomonas sp. MH10]
MSEPIIGGSPRRIDGRRKVTGTALYASDHHPKNMAYGYGVFSTIASGKVTALNLDEARKSPGVIDIFHSRHFAEVYHTSPIQTSPANILTSSKADENRLPFEDDTVHYAGQFVALVVADTFEHARAAAYKVAVSYSKSPTVANLQQGLKAGPPKEGGRGHSRGDPGPAFDQAPHFMDATYTTPVETHNPMEMHATIAYWEDGHLYVYEATQGVVAHRNALSRIFGVTPDRVEVRAPFIGSGFGSKLWIWPHSVAACGAAKMLDRPVQLVVPRQQMFTTTGHRPATQQRVRLATDAQGKLISVRHESINTTSFTDQYVENCGTSTRSLYSCANVLVSQKTVEVNHGTPTSMRAPGAAPGLFALESAMDEMAEIINMDPMAFRKLNVADRDESQNLPWSSNHLQDAIDQAAERFGWQHRDPRIGVMQEGHEKIGYGMAACNWDAYRTPAEARVSLRADGTAYAICGVQDIGTGTYTVIAQAISSLTGLPLDKIEVELGNSSFPPAPVSGGSWATASVLPAVAEATRQAITQLKAFATSPRGAFAGANADSLGVEGGNLKSADKSMAIADVLNAQKLASADGQAHTGMAETDKYSFRSFGAHFVEVRWDPGISRLRVARVVSAIDVGQVINQKTASNQVEGAIVMAIGMALFEGTEYDERNAMPVNNNYAEYVVPVHADQPDVEVILLNYPDYKLNEFGARGIGEIGVTGLAAAIANAVYHATGKRVRDLPISLDKLMAEEPMLRA